MSIQNNEFDINQEINLESLSAYFKWKFPERYQRYLDFEETSEMILRLRDCGYVKLKQLDEVITQTLPILKEFESEYFKIDKLNNAMIVDEEGPRNLLYPDGLIRAMLDLTNDEHFARPMPSEIRNLMRKYREKLD